MIFVELPPMDGTSWKLSFLFPKKECLRKQSKIGTASEGVPPTPRAQVCSGAWLHQLGHLARTFPAPTGSGSAKDKPWYHGLAVALSEWCRKGHPPSLRHEQ